MIVVGTHGESPLRTMVLGSTTYRLVHITTKPLLVVPAAKRRRTSA
jgi:nucleotide-binding universal stress UspA family protein